MASAALARISGSVLSVPEPRSGLIKSGPRQGEPWRIETANILVADQNVTAVQLPRRDDSGKLENLEGLREVVKGDLIDFLCEVTVYGQEVQFRVLGLWPEDDASNLAS